MNNMIITLAKGIVGESNVKTDEPMSSHTTFRVGGAADLYITPQNESQLASLIKLFRQTKLLELSLHFVIIILNSFLLLTA